MISFLKWISILGISFVVLLVVVGMNYKPDSPKALLQKAAKNCFVEKAQNRESTQPCREMQNTANSL